MQAPNTDYSYASDQTSGLSTETKLLLMQQQLALILHADHCRRLEQAGLAINCLDRHCLKIRSLFPHLEICEKENDCAVAHCISSKFIIRHYKACKDMECKVCSVIRKPGYVFDATPSNVTCIHNGITPIKCDMPPVNGIRTANSPLHSSTSSEAHCSSLLNGEVPRLPLKEARITDHQRELAMKKFVKDISLSIFPTANPTAYSDPRMKQFLDYVKRMEKDVFMKSKSTEDYYKTMTLRYHNILSELKEKRRLRGVQKPNGDTSDNSISVEMSDSIKNEASTRKATTYEQDNFSEALEIVCKRDDNVQQAIKLEVQSETISKSSLPSENCLQVDSPDHKSSDPSRSVVTDNVDSKSRDVQKQEGNTISTKTPDEKTSDFGTLTSVAVEPIKRKVWSPDELLQHLLPVVLKLSKERDAEPFLQPVDWKLLEIYDYPQIVSDPMDLSTIRGKLEDGMYKDPWDVVDDFWLMLNNAWLYNKKTSKVYKTCTRLAETFETCIDPVMQALGFCCGREYYYQPPTLTCLTPKFCTIHRDAVYYVYKSDGQTPGLLEQKYTVCERCYNEAVDEIALDSDSTTPVTVQKNLMEKLKNDVKEKEPFVFCKHCGRKWHKVCAIYMEEIWPDGFICNHCITTYGLKKQENRSTARKLTTCKLSNFLEKRVNDFLKKKEADAGDVIIRVLAAADKTVEVKAGMKAKFCETGEMPESFPYRVKAIFAFQEIDGQEVCFFGLHVQEYGSECSMPNTRRVYVAYLDSVYFFRPKQYRTEIYHELLVGYIHYAKLLGFTMAHIWACPPSEGDDYIFHMHPPDQRIPKPKRLQEWYQKMLKKALFERIVVDYKDICQDANESHMVSPTELAYFEGDFWPNTLEEIFKEMDEEDAKRKREQEALAREDDDDETKESVQSRENDENPGKKKAKRRKLKRSASMNITGKRKRLGPPGSSDVANEVIRRVYEIMEKHKENFFVIRLHPQNVVGSLAPIKDPDPLINSELMECRGAFLEKAREKHLEFSSLRRAKYSTLAMLYELHNENRQPLMYTCNVCSVQLETPWHCKQCVEYDLCPQCYETENHPHPMIKIGLGLDDCNKGQEADNDAAVQESGRDKLSRLVKALGHSCSCRDANCRVYACKTIKTQVQHFRVHAASGRNQCSVCRILSYLCYYHSKTCHELKCPVPLCPNLKAKMKQQQKQQRLKQTQMLRRRMATMQRCNSMTPSHQPTPPPSQPHQQCSQSSASECVSSPMSVSTQSSPFSSVTITSAPFSLTSPVSRTQSSIQSPLQNHFYHPGVPNTYQNSQLHSKAFVPSPSLPGSPSVSSLLPNTIPQCSSSVSPYNQAIHEADSSIQLDNRPMGCGLHPQLRHTPLTPSTSSTPQQMLRVLPHEHPQNDVSVVGSVYSTTHLGIAQSYHQSGPQSSFIHRSQPSSMDSPLPSKPIQNFGSHGCMNSTDMNSSYSPSLSSHQHFQGESQSSGYIPKQHQRMPSHSYNQGADEYPNTPFPHPNHYLPSGTNNSSNWKQLGSMISYTTGSSNIGINTLPPPSRTCTTQPLPTQCVDAPNPSASASSGISPEDLRIVQQAYTAMRQRGAPPSEFSSWLTTNPQYVRAWQYIQQTHTYNQQQSQNPGHSSFTQPYPMTSHLPNAYPACQTQIQQTGSLRSAQQSRHPYSQLQQPNQPWASVPLQTRFRQSGIGFNQTASPSNFPQQLPRVPCGAAASVPHSNPQRHMNQTALAHSSSHMQVHQVAVTSPIPNMVRCPSGAVQQVAHLPRCMSSNPTAVVGQSVGPRPAQPSPHYSSVMLSQLLGPGQTNNSGSTIHVPGNEYSVSNKHQLIHQELVTPAQNIPLHPHYQDGNL